MEISPLEVLKTFYECGLLSWPSKTYCVFKLHVRNRQNVVMIEESNGDHAEDNFINVMRQNIAFNRNETIILYLNYSPCDGCAEKLIKFLQDHREIRLRIFFVQLYRINGPVNK